MMQTSMGMAACCLAVLIASISSAKAEKRSFACRGIMKTGPVDVSGSYSITNKTYYAGSHVEIVAPGVAYAFSSQNVTVGSDGIIFRLNASEKSARGGVNSVSVRHNEGKPNGADIHLIIYNELNVEIINYKTVNGKCRFN